MFVWVDNYAFWHIGKQDTYFCICPKKRDPLGSDSMSGWVAIFFPGVLVQSSRNLQLLRCDFDVGFVRKGLGDACLSFNPPFWYVSIS